MLINARYRQTVRRQIIVSEMRNWLIDAYAEHDADLSHFTDDVIIRAIVRRYDGGVRQFIRDIRPLLSA